MENSLSLRVRNLELGTSSVSVFLSLCSNECILPFIVQGECLH
jgi:hypothetical protein